MNSQLFKIKTTDTPCSKSEFEIVDELLAHADHDGGLALGHGRGRERVRHLEEAERPEDDPYTAVQKMMETEKEDDQ